MKNNTNFFERLELIASLYSFKGIRELSQHMGYTSAQKLYRLKQKPDAKPSLDIILDFTNKFDNLNIEWLITGKGNIEKDQPELILKDEENKYSVQKFVAPKVVTVGKTGKDNIVLVPEKAAAGYLSGYGDPEFIQSLPIYNLPNIKNGTYRMFQVSGHSMYPTLHNGSFVVGEWVENWTGGIKDDRIYVIVSKTDGLIVKRVLNRTDKYNSLYCKSDNRREYPNFAINPKDLLEVWEVKMHLSFELPNPTQLYDRVNDLEAKVMNLENQIPKK